MTRVKLIAAVSENNMIGRDGELPWHIPEELAHFKRETMGHVVVMGRKTAESVGRRLPGRHLITVTRDLEWEGSYPTEEFREAMHKATRLAKRVERDIYIAGGAMIYHQALEGGWVDEIILSRIHGTVDGDTEFPWTDVDGWEWDQAVRHYARPYEFTVSRGRPPAELRD